MVYFKNMKQKFGWGYTLNIKRVLDKIEKLYDIGGTKSEAFISTEEIILALNEPDRMVKMADLTPNTRAKVIDSIVMRGTPITLMEEQEMNKLEYERGRFE